ncbi:hypothetical protein Tco_0846364 [Tanacetum coccineum]
MFVKAQLEYVQQCLPVSAARMEEHIRLERFFRGPVIADIDGAFDSKVNPGIAKRKLGDADFGWSNTIYTILHQNQHRHQSCRRVRELEDGLFPKGYSKEACQNGVAKIQRMPATSRTVTILRSSGVDHNMGTLVQARK